MLALDARRERRLPSRGEQRQRRALAELASALALVFPHRHDPEFMERAVPHLLAMMRRADRRERHGVAHLELLPQTEPPLPRGSCKSICRIWGSSVRCGCGRGSKGTRI